MIIQWWTSSWNSCSWITNFLLNKSISCFSEIHYIEELTFFKHKKIWSIVSNLTDFAITHSVSRHNNHDWSQERHFDSSWYQRVRPVKNLPHSFCWSWSSRLGILQHVSCTQCIDPPIIWYSVGPSNRSCRLWSFNDGLVVIYHISKWSMRQAL